MLSRKIVTLTEPSVFLKISDFAAEDDKKAVCDEDRIKLLGRSTCRKPCHQMNV